MIPIHLGIWFYSNGLNWVHFYNYPRFDCVVLHDNSQFHRVWQSEVAPCIHISYHIRSGWSLLFSDSIWEAFYESGKGWCSLWLVQYDLKKKCGEMATTGVCCSAVNKHRTQKTTWWGNAQLATIFLTASQSSPFFNFLICSLLY